MNERQQTPRFKPKRKNRGAAVAAVLCFTAAIAIVGTYTFKDYRESQREIEQMELSQAKTEEQREKTEDSKPTNTDLIINEKADDTLTKVAEAASEKETETEEEEEPEASQAESTEQTAGKSNAVNFAGDSKLLWPVEGTLLMNYSMDKTVYFSTLDQFKYNPALVIAGEKGDQVISSAPGIVKSIDKTAETGTTINVDIGGGYELFYGQLNDVKVKTGDYVDSKSVLGYVGDPTIYYSVEGCNVYFEMRKDGQPVNPMDYLVE